MKIFLPVQTHNTTLLHRFLDSIKCKTHPSFRYFKNVLKCVLDLGNTVKRIMNSNGVFCASALNPSTFRFRSLGFKSSIRALVHSIAQASSVFHLDKQMQRNHSHAHRSCLSRNEAPTIHPRVVLRLLQPIAYLHFKLLLHGAVIKHRDDRLKIRHTWGTHKQYQNPVIIIVIIKIIIIKEL